MVAITGCTSGTGYVAARTAARKGAHVVMLNRPSARATAAAAQLASDVPGAAVTAVACDLSSFASVREAAAALNSQFSAAGLDVLCNNAGVMALADEATADGYDVQMQTNHLGHFLLAKEVFGLLETAASLRGEARVVHHTSLARLGSALAAKYLGPNGGQLGGNGSSMLLNGARWERYHQSKLANAVCTAALAEKLRAAGSKVIALAAAPGLAATNLQVTTAQGGGMGSGTWFMRFGQSAEDGAMPLIACVARANVQNGDFYEPVNLGGLKGLPAKTPLTDKCSNAQATALLWEASEAACGAWGEIKTPALGSLIRTG